MLGMLKYRSQDTESPDMLTCITQVQKSLPIRMRSDLVWHRQL